MPGRLSGKVALITGAARGIGEAEARLFAAEGAALMLGDVLEKEVEALRDDLRGAGATVEAGRLDVSSEDDWAAAVQATTRAHGRIDILVNNAAIFSLAPLEDTTREMFDQIVAVNQTGSFLGMKAVIPAMRETGGGSVINTSSIYGLIGSGAATAYQCTKGAVRLLSKTAAVQYAPEGIRVNSLHPGVVQTPMLDENIPAEAVPMLEGQTPMGRFARPEEIAYAALFLASDEASFVTGAELVVDGGYTAP